MTTATPTTKPSEIPTEVPSFLRKTYHMIDSCDPSIAGWSEDGTTFVVKNPTKFEREIIPQFFKHNKFSSFVRQLNFYSFRKIKYMDSIRLLDPKTEAQVANYWRFHHENFQRGCPQKLLAIKRMTASSTQNNTNSNNRSGTANTGGATPDQAKSNNGSGSSAGGGHNEAMKSEIDTLKKRLEEMNKNMTELTTMVQKVTLKEETQTPAPQATAAPPEDDVAALPGAKRKKVSPEDVLQPDPAHSLSNALPALLPTPPTSNSSNNETVELEDDDLITPSEIMFSDSMELDALPTAQQPVSREVSDATDQDFVDQLFSAFEEEQSNIHDTDNRDGENDDMMMMTMMGADDALPDPSLFVENNSKQQRADPELMERLSEALAILPKEMQEQIVNRLIASIMSNDIGFKTTTTSTTSNPPTLVPGGGGKLLSLSDDDDDDEDDNSAHQQTTPAQVEGMPLAAATLASLLSYYSTLIKENRNNNSGEKILKNIPVIPCHA